MINYVYQQLYTENTLQKATFKHLHTSCSNINKIIENKSADILKLEAELERAKQDLKTFEGTRRNVQTQMLMLTDGVIGRPIDITLVCDPDNNSPEKITMQKYMWGYFITFKYISFYKFIKLDVSDEMVNIVYNTVRTNMANNDNRNRMDLEEIRDQL